VGSFNLLMEISREKEKAIVLKPKTLAPLCDPTFPKKHACFAAQD
jgi:hypothetical protein